MFKRILVPLLFFFCFSIQISAQWSVGISGGATLSFREWNFPTPDFGISYDPGLAYNAGLAGEWRGGQVFSLRAEAGYQVWRSRLGNVLTDENGEVIAATLKDDLKALSGALFAKITPFRQVNLYFLTGPAVARIVENKGIIKSKDDLPAESPSSITFDLEEKGIEPNQYFVNFGIGNAFKCGTKGHLTVEARYQLGLSDLSSASTVDARISTLMLNVGYLYQL